MGLDYVMSAMFSGKYKNIQVEVAHLYSVLEAVLPRIRKQIGQMWMWKSLVAKVYRKQVFQATLCEKYFIYAQNTLASGRAT